MAPGYCRRASEASGHSRRGRVCRCAVVGLVAFTFGCSTTHALGRIADPGTVTELERLTARPGTYARIEPLPGAPRRSPGDPVRALTRDGLVIAAFTAPPEVVPLARVRSVSTYDHLRGMRDGALALGIPGFIVGATLAEILINRKNTDGCGDCQAEPGPEPVPTFFGLAGLFGLCGALLGAGLGALAGHEDRYVINAR
jgi:MYXO-CTERM domain-containing protein